ncbi:hypothetical protein NQ042_03105 [Corynebacterium phoceense]|uniref:hypothetical protein n=1 Tax=Corynebacterium phoceense TaxID=1686286 RepID=UPI00211C5DF1|nr:hypothetical protein [Corynebacterium phoceense]MCQ9333098.1 hypothetical protein [Corynebacterium phoceense]
MKLNTNQISLDANTAKQVSVLLGTSDFLSFSGMTAELSSISGVRETGSIHDRLLGNDPASAKALIDKLSGQVDWIGGQLRKFAVGAIAQDMLAAHSLEAVETGGISPDEIFMLDPQPDASYGTVHFVKPVVAVGMDALSVIAEVLSLDANSISATLNQWKSVSASAGEAAAQLEAMAASLEQSNEGESIDAAVAKIREIAGTGSEIAANAGAMAGRTGAMLGLSQVSKLMALSIASTLSLPMDPVSREAVEQSGLVMMQNALQSMVDVSLPPVASIAQPQMRASGGDFTAGMDAVNASGFGLSTDEVDWPKSFEEAVVRGAVGPGSFEIVDGQLRPANDIGLSAKDLAQLNKAAQTYVPAIYDAAGLPELSQALTTPASVGTLPSAAGLTAGLHGGVGGVAGGLSGGAPGIGALSGGGASPANLGGASGLGAAAGLGGGMNSGLGGSGIGAAPMGALGGAGGGAAGAASRGGGVRGGIGSRVGMPAAGGLGAGVGRVGLPGAGGVATGGAAGAGAGGVGSTGAGVRAGGVGGGAAHRAMVPMMGAGHGQGDKRGKVKTVTTAVEQDQNRRALLGEVPPSVPGVIGAWVRD